MKALGTKTPEDINRLARLSVLTLIAFVAVAVGAFAIGGGGGEPAADTFTVVSPLPGSLTAPGSTSTTPGAPTGDTEVLAAGILPVPSVASTIEGTSTSTTAPAAATSTTSPATTTTTTPPSTTTTSTSTTSTSTTTTSSTTTTTLPPTTTSTTVPPTTTTTVSPTTTTIPPPTTTTTTIVDDPTMFVADLDSEVNCCDNDAWFGRVRVTVRSNTGEPVEDAVVAAAWRVGDAGAVAISRTNSNGIAVFEGGPFTVKQLTFSVFRLTHPNYVYDASSNEETSITFGPE